MDNALSFTMFFFAFLFILITIITVIPVPDDILTGLSPDEIEAVTDPLEPPDETATFWETLLYYTPGSGIGFWLNKLYILSGASSAYQIISVIIGIWVSGLLLVIYTMLRGN